jgi:uncharacterized membrane protein
MVAFAAALAAFFAAHVLPAYPPLRGRLIGAFGRRTYLGLYALLSAALLAWVVVAALKAPYVELWPPSPWRFAVPVAAMPLALAFLGAGLLQPNPLSISLARIVQPTRVEGALAVTRHPVLWGFLVWSAAHLVANGNVVAVILFGSMALFSALGMHVLDRRARQRLGKREWQRLAAATSILPFAALLRDRRPLRLDRRSAVGAALGLAVYLVLLAVGHVWLLGLDPLVFWKT